MSANPTNVLLLDPAGQEFEQAIASWNARVRHQPEAAVAPRSADDVAAAVRHAVDNTMRVRVQATGHGACAAFEGGLLISMGGLREVSVDPRTRSASISAGAQWKDVLTPAYQHGLAPLIGTSSDVGAVGYTLGGGTSWFARAYGLACDAVQQAQVVTADGSLRWVDADHEPDLFWALRGGGANFGVVTALRMGLVSHAEVYAGSLVWPVELFAEVAKAWRDWVAGLPAELTSSLAVLHAPDAPFVPEPMRGKSFVAVLGCFAGDPADGDRWTRQLRTVDGLLMDTFGPLPITRIDEVAQDPVDPLPHWVWGTMLSRCDDSVIERLARIAPRGAAPYVILEVRHVGGGVRPDPDRQGLAHWSGDFMLELISATPVPAAVAAAEALGSQLDDELADASTGMTPLNFVGSADRVGRAFTQQHLDRLREIKRRYDPANLFGGDRPLPAG